MPTAPTGRLLVVDDDVSVMTALCDTLRDEGYRVTGFASGAEGLAALRKDHFDLVLTDLMMPKMDGIAFLHDALAIDPALVAIVMTGHGSIPTAVNAMKTGAIDYVLKPIKLTALLPALERALTVRRLRAKNVELEDRVRRRTAELELANRDLEGFSSSISHELRTPLRTITGFTEILLDQHADHLSPEVRHLVELTRAGADEMTQMIDGLLALSRFGRQAILPETVELEPLCRNVFKELERDHAGRHVELRINPLPIAYGDRMLLRQVLINLISNALKYTRPRALATIELGVTATNADATPVFFVRDNGVGFDLHAAEHVFGVFQRFHRASEFEGTGVGLATVRRIIERHGGRIWAETAPDAGATFFFTLPLASGRESDAKSG